MSNQGADRLSSLGEARPRTSFNAEIGPHRRFAFGSVAVDDVRTIKDAFDVRFNDVVMTLCATAIRRYLLERNELPAEPLVAMVPVSVRDTGSSATRISNVNASLHTHVEDPIARLQSIHASMLLATELQGAVPADVLQDLADFSPPSVNALAARGLARASSRWIDPPHNVVITNVPGPQFPLYSGGARVAGSFPISAISNGAGLNFTVQSYDGSLDIGIVGCRDLVPDVWGTLDHMRNALSDLLVLASDAPAPSPASNGAATIPVAKAVARTAAPKKTAPKKTAPQKTAKKTTAPKTTTSKKSTAKTAARKKSPTKRSTKKARAKRSSDATKRTAGESKKQAAAKGSAR